MASTVTKAVIPAAGFGTRMLPLTENLPKEMLPVHGKPMIHHVVEEAVASGIDQLCVVVRQGKGVIQRYFEDPETPPPGLAEAVRDLETLRDRCEVVFRFQEKPIGLGDAILCARDFVAGDSFAMLVPDQLFVGAVPALSQLQRPGLPGSSIVSSLIRLSAGQIRYFPGARRFVCEATPESADLVAIIGIEADDAESGDDADPSARPQGFGRTIFPPEIFAFLGENFADPRTGEVDLLKTFEAVMGKIPSYGVYLKGDTFDLGTVAGYHHFLPRLKALAAPPGGA